jgi:uncharacterized protein YcaQ
LTLTNAQARRFLLAHHGLWPPHALGGKDGVLDYIRRVGCIQFDPLNIVGRNPDLVLQSRIADYRPEMLQELLYQDRRLVDGWDKNMSIYCLEDWPFFRRRREGARRHYGDPSRPAVSVLPEVRRAIEERGPLSSIDLDLNQTVKWSWAPTRVARAALESMYWWGELIVHHKINTRKVYDLARRHISEELLAAPEPNETEEQYHDWYVSRRIGGIGLLWNRSGDAWLGMRSIKSKDRKAALARLLEREQIVEAGVEGIDLPLYMRCADRATLDRVLSADPLPPRAAILAPLDNLLWDRRLVQELFGFTYIWEVYKPVVERQYGYYVLPILYGNRFVARFEPGRDKRSGALTIANWWWESGVTPSAQMQSELSDCLDRFLCYLGRDELRVEEQAVERADLGWLL